MLKSLVFILSFKIVLLVKGLQNLQPFDSSTNDLISQRNMTIQLNGQLVSDRLGNAESALRLSKGYGTVPPDIYFDPDTGGFAIMTLLKLISTGGYQRVIDFGTGCSDNVILCTYGTSTKMYLQTRIGTTSTNFQSTGSLVLGVWTLVTVTGNRTMRAFYFNGIFDSKIAGFYYISSFHFKNIRSKVCLFLI